jgi:isoquinoline 1-oxidoreductase subunit alpha
MQIVLKINGIERRVDVDPDTPLLWVLRESLGLTGTKFGCGIGACGACTVHLNGVAVRSCSLAAVTARDQAITTIEGLASTTAGGDSQLHPVQAAWIAQQVPQCGYCQSGMIMAVAAMLAQVPDPSDAQIDAMITNICRCGTYERVRRAIRSLARPPSASASSARLAESNPQSATQQGDAHG